MQSTSPGWDVYMLGHVVYLHRYCVIQYCELSRSTATVWEVVGFISAAAIHSDKP